MKTRVPLQPLLHLGMFVRGVVVGDQVQILPGGRHLVDHAQELQPFLMAMAVIAHADHSAVGHVESGK